MKMKSRNMSYNLCLCKKLSFGRDGMREHQSRCQLRINRKVFYCSKCDNNQPLLDDWEEFQLLHLECLKEPREDQHVKMCFEWLVQKGIVCTEKNNTTNKQLPDAVVTVSTKKAFPISRKKMPEDMNGKISSESESSASEDTPLLPVPMMTPHLSSSFDSLQMTVRRTPIASKKMIPPSDVDDSNDDETSSSSDDETESDEKSVTSMPTIGIIDPPDLSQKAKTTTTTTTTTTAAAPALGQKKTLTSMPTIDIVDPPVSKKKAITTTTTTTAAAPASGQMLKEPAPKRQDSRRSPKKMVSNMVTLPAVFNLPSFNKKKRGNKACGTPTVKMTSMPIQATPKQNKRFINITHVTTIDTWAIVKPRTKTINID